MGLGWAASVAATASATCVGLVQASRSGEHPLLLRPVIDVRRLAANDATITRDRRSISAIDRSYVSSLMAGIIASPGDIDEGPPEEFALTDRHHRWCARIWERLGERGLVW